MIEKLNFNDDTLFNELMRIVESLKVFSNSNSKSTQTSSKRILIGNMIVDVSSPFITLEKSISELLKKIQRFYFEMNEMQKKYSSDGIVSLSSFKKISDSKIIETLKEFHKMLKDKTESIKKTKSRNGCYCF
ncbi:hypothetical protein M0811_13533 [Anaeramoeba ignava]|uniref:Uncharacterized protein n=1 Tax=Anaeramoeba ignava TaxID=1746090 RepID=A0A9Q0R469_ANAIG|nr:hypothetical protein M0811_13533 [Anaeramoeba ignava]